MIFRRRAAAFSPLLAALMLRCLISARPLAALFQRCRRAEASAEVATAALAAAAHAVLHFSPLAATACRRFSPSFATLHFISPLLYACFAAASADAAVFAAGCC